MAEDSSNGAVSSASTTIRYGGHDRFVLELEFVQMLANPRYLNHLATNKYFDNDEFVAYLGYLQYFRQPNYIRYLQFPGPTLRALDLLQEASFRKDIISPKVTEDLAQKWLETALAAA